MKLSRSVLLRGALALATASLFSACGGDPSPSAAISVSPAKGAVYGAPVAVYDARGRLLGDGTTSREDGKVNVDLYELGVAPYTIEVKLVRGASLWDESAANGAGAEVTLDADQGSMLAIALQLNTPIGVTPLTSLAAAIAGLSDPRQPPENFNTDTVVNSVATVNALSGLSDRFDINQAPVAPSRSDPDPASGSYGALLKAMALASSNRGGPLKQLADLVSAGEQLATGSELSDDTLATALTVNTAAEAAGMVGVTPPPINRASLDTRVSEIKASIEAILEGQSPTGVTGITGVTGLSN